MALLKHKHQGVVLKGWSRERLVQHLRTHHNCSGYRAERMGLKAFEEHRRLHSEGDRGGGNP